MGLDQTLGFGRVDIVATYEKPEYFITVEQKLPGKDRENVFVDDPKIQQMAAVMGFGVASDGTIRDKSDIDDNGALIEAYNFSTMDAEIDFRKFNALQRWMEEKFDCQNCRDVVIPMEYVELLKDICRKVLEARDEKVSAELFPTGSGFFYGSLEYNDWYYNDVKRLYDFIDEHGTQNDCMYVYWNWY